MALKTGAQVRVILPVITGEVVGGAFVDGEPQYLVRYTDAEGDLQVRYFPVEKLEEVAQPTE